MVSRMYERQLTLSGAKAVAAANGVDGLKALAAQKIDCVLLDLMMPKMNGYETLKRIREDEVLKRIPVIILTNLKDYAFDEDLKRIRELKPDDFVIKSEVVPRIVVEKIRAILARKR